MRPSTIGINAHLLSSVEGYRRAGIHVYQAGVLESIPQDPTLAYQVFTQVGRDILPSPWLNPVPARIDTSKPIQRIVWEQLFWARQARRRQVDLFHSMAFVLPIGLSQPGIVTVYDLSFMHYPEAYPRFRRLYLQSQTARSARAARRVIAISESGRQDIHRFFQVPLDAIDVVYPGLSPYFSPPARDDVTSYKKRASLPDRFILHVGTLQPRKNLLTLIDAFHRIRRPDLHLVLAGGKGWFYDQIFALVERLGLENQVHFTGYVDDRELPLLYAASDLFVFPSYYEGFGMPIVEAMACGVPVIASNASAMPEAIGEAGLMFEADRAEALADSMVAVLENPAQMAKMREAGHMQARKFSWKTSGTETASIYKTVLAEASGR